MRLKLTQMFTIRVNFMEREFSMKRYGMQYCVTFTISSASHILFPHPLLTYICPPPFSLGSHPLFCPHSEMSMNFKEDSK